MKDSTEGIVVEVHVHRDEHGRVHSNRRLRGESDQQVALSWPSGGMEQVAFALLVEAMRQEALLQILIKESQEPGFIARLTASKAEVDAEVALLRKALENQMATLVPRLAESAVLCAIRHVQG